MVTRASARVLPSAEIVSGESLVARADRHGEFLDLAAADDRRGDLRADAIWGKQALQVVGVGDAVAVDADQDVTLEESSRRGRAAVRDLGDHQAARLAASQVLRRARERDRLGADT